jgi:hypothetical protein
MTGNPDTELLPDDDMTPEQILEELAEVDAEILTADGFEEAIIGSVQIFNKVVALYDRDRCLEVLMKRDGMTHEEAEEFFDYNVTGGYHGELTPAFATIRRK